MEKQCTLLVVGGGICGLYQAMKCIKKDVHATVIVVEKEAQCGGRTLQTTFANVIVPTGAAVGRLGKDRKLLKLLKDLDIESNTWLFKMNIDKTISPVQDVKKTIEVLEKNLVQSKYSQNFKEFAINVLGLEKYEKFVEVMGYTDFENLDAYDALNNYELSDCFEHGQSMFSVPWNEVIRKMQVFLSQSGRCSIFTNTQVLLCNDMGVSLSNGQTIHCDRHIIAIPPACITEPLMPLADPNIHYRDILHQPFLYIYIQTDDLEFKHRFSKYTVVPRPLQKVIPMDIDKGVFMVAYADNESALRLNKEVTSKKSLTDTINSVLGIRVKLNKYLKIFRELGTHYRLNHKVYRKSNIFKGEAFAKNQGWTNGGL